MELTKKSCVAGEELISPIAGDHEFHVSGGESGHAMGGDRGDVGERFTERPKQSFDLIDPRSGEDLMVVFTPVAFRREPGILDLVVVRIVETEGEHRYGGVGMPGEKRNEKARVEPTREKSSGRNVSQGAEPNGVLEKMKHFFREAFDPSIFRRVVGKLPPRLNLDRVLGRSASSSRGVRERVPPNRG